MKHGTETSATVHAMHTITETKARRKSSVKMRCNIMPTINSLCILKKRSTEENMLHSVLSSLLTPDQARKIALIMPLKTAFESVNFASSASAASASTRSARPTAMEI